MKPDKIRMVVLLPAPFGPSSPTIFATRDGKRNVVHRRATSIALCQVGYCFNHIGSGTIEVPVV